jgi:hypothetical protein
MVSSLHVTYALKGVKVTPTMVRGRSICMREYKGSALYNTTV